MYPLLGDRSGVTQDVLFDPVIGIFVVWENGVVTLAPKTIINVYSAPVQELIRKVASTTFTLEHKYQCAFK